MKYNTKFSLVLATLGRINPVDDFLQSICVQDYPIELIEVVVVDQNIEPVLDDVIRKYNDHISITHIRSSVTGLSVNRNIGIRHCSGDIISFPDDDCLYPADTLRKVAKYMSEKKLSFILGKIWDNKINKDAFRSWPSKNKRITKWNFYRLTSSITLFTKVHDIYFDERFGVGAKYGSNEDTAFIYTLLCNSYSGNYNKDVVIYHEDQPINKLPMNKVASYSYGFGKFSRCYLSVPILYIFFLSLLFQIINMLISFVKIDRDSLIYRFISFKKRLYGFMSVK
ncbi:hypothetical protein CE143_24715 [Photorhabdus luminescens]|uniref:Glycosyltransferase 2-like domain-containing protein n=1 Tax=Photorhabdus akhurstii TaxID=171438 RepID=A0ABX8M1E9_9GAMM|nr:glycosyltransferase family 2 protein [Photorhabdus akhurstii]QXF36025.1 hypothetical protein B0X70_24675 [Photorhabdus akhurstii]UJD77865.1 hypothetical protein CE143_24715 [Photorhabdus luminescens]